MMTCFARCQNERLGCEGEDRVQGGLLRGDGGGGVLGPVPMPMPVGVPPGVLPLTVPLPVPLLVCVYL